MGNVYYKFSIEREGEHNRVTMRVKGEDNLLMLITNIGGTFGSWLLQNEKANNMSEGWALTMGDELIEQFSLSLRDYASGHQNVTHVKLME